MKTKTNKPALRLRKFIFNNHVHFITCSVEEGIMFPANPLSKFLIKAALLRAQRLHPVTISHFLVNGTHIHMIVRVDDPEDIPGFMERFKTESSHYINRLLNRKKRTIWCEGYDSPRCKNIEDVMSKIAYTYANPVQDGLIESVDNYPGLSSWHIFNGRQFRIFGTFLGRDNFFPVLQSLDFSDFKKLAKVLAKQGDQKEVKIDTNDWFKAFGAPEQEEIDEVNGQIKHMIQTIEEEKREKYKEENKTFMGRRKLENQGIRKDYQRNLKESKKVWVVCSDTEERVSYIAFLKELALEAREVYQNWCNGDTSERMPVGVFAPRMPVMANLIVD